MVVAEMMFLEEVEKMGAGKSRQAAGLGAASLGYVQKPLKILAFRLKAKVFIHRQVVRIVILFQVRLGGAARGVGLG
jgi:hypothetical protein